MKRFIIFLLVCTIGLVYNSAQSALISIGKINIDNLGMNKRMIRFSDNGIIVDKAGLCVQVNVGIKATGLAGKRLICLVAPLDKDGYMLQDNLGDAESSAAITIPNQNYSGILTVPLPYSWVITDINRKLESIKLGVSVICFGDDDLTANKEVILTESDINIDRSKLGSKLMGDMLGFSEGGAIGGLLGAFFDSSDAESTETCPVCDGTGVCQHCDGDAYIDPSICRKCHEVPGICRRCKGEGTITIKYDIY